MKKSPKQFARALYEFTKELPENRLSEAVGAFVRVLAKNRVMNKANAIISEFTKISEKAEGIERVSVTTARELGKKTIAHVLKAFEATDISAMTVDEDLIGGVVVKTDEKIFDASMRGRVRALHAAMR